MPKVHKGTVAGHGGFFKWDDRAPLSPKLNTSNSTFRADQDANHQDLNLPTGYDVTCSNNTMVWLGDGPFPGSLPSCFTVTTVRSVWDHDAGERRNERLHFGAGQGGVQGDPGPQDRVGEGDAGYQQ
ncbi:MAG: hypothetical protein JJE46_07410 [Acidimicrobiia bacterium]|nr:hypothetical protein [Acidimicrobiia bacterium]